MALSDTKLKSIHNKFYDGKPEVTDGSGLSVRISPHGVIAFQYRYRWQGKPVRLTIGRYPSIALKDARVIVEQMRELYAKGHDPKVYFSKAIAKATLQDCLEYWLALYVSTLKPNTQTLYKSVLFNTMYAEFKFESVENIPIASWQRFFYKQQQENPKKARVVLIQLKSMLNWCIQRQFIASCEVMRLLPKNVGKRADVGHRVLTYYELAKIWLALESSQTASSNKVLHQLILLYGCRLSEMRLARANEFNLENMMWTIPAAHSKKENVIQHPIFKHVEPYLEKLLKSGKDVLFYGKEFTKPIDLSSCNLYIRNLRRKIDIPEWRTQDFKRSLSANLSNEGIMPHIIDEMLGYKRGDIKAGYHKYDWLTEQRHAYELYADKIFWHVKRLSD